MAPYSQRLLVERPLPHTLEIVLTLPIAMIVMGITTPVDSVVEHMLVLRLE